MFTIAVRSHIGTSRLYTFCRSPYSAVFSIYVIYIDKQQRRRLLVQDHIVWNVRLMHGLVETAVIVALVENISWVSSTTYLSPIPSNWRVYFFFGYRSRCFDFHSLLAILCLGSLSAMVRGKKQRKESKHGPALCWSFRDTSAAEETEWWTERTNKRVMSGDDTSITRCLLIDSSLFVGRENGGHPAATEFEWLYIYTAWWCGWSVGQLLGLITTTYERKYVWKRRDDVDVFSLKFKRRHRCFAADSIIFLNSVWYLMQYRFSPCWPCYTS